MNMSSIFNKRRFLIVLVLGVILLGLVFGTGWAQTGAPGTVVVWGDNTYGQSTIPYAPGAAAIAAGYMHNLVLKNDGTVVAWGSNEFGESSVPSGLNGVTAIAAGERHNLALKSDGTIAAWGWNSRGPCSVPAGLTDVKAIAAGDFHSLALKNDGTVVAWGDNDNGESSVPSGLSDVIAVAGGGEHSLALKSDGTVVAWGSDKYGQTSVPATATDIIAIAAGYSYSLALKSDTTLVAWGDNTYGAGDQPPGISDGIIAIAAGMSHNLAITSYGTVVAWGYSASGQTAVPYGLRGVVAIAAGGAHSLALTSGGAVVAWGADDYGQGSVPEELTGVIAVAASGNHNLALKNDGTLVAWGSSDCGMSGVPSSVTGVTAIAAGDCHNLVLKADGTVAAWGSNFYGESTIPVGLSGVNAIAAGISHNLALKNDGTIVAWGNNTYGQSNIPSDLGGVTAIAAGGLHSMALKNDGTVVAWGDNTYGQSTVPLDLTGVTAIAAGDFHSLALKGDGTVVAWGFDGQGQGSVPVGLSGVTAIAAGGYHNLALKNDGTLAAWGWNDYGQTNIPVDLSGVTAIAAGYTHSLALISDQVATAPDVTTQPQSQTVNVGDAASFSAVASGEPTPTVQWQMSTDSGTTWTDITDATASPLTITAGLDQNGNQYRAVFTNSSGSATSDSATLTVSKKSATVTLSSLTQTYDATPKPATVTTDPASLSVALTYNGSASAPTDAGEYTVVATINDSTYQGSASGTLNIQPKAVSVTLDSASKVYGDADPALTGTLSGFIDADGVTAAYSRTAGEAVGAYIISAALSPTEKLNNYGITYNTAAFTITPRPIQVTADGKSKVFGEADPALTYQITSGSLAFSDAFTGELARNPGETLGIYAILQGTLALDSNYNLTYLGANFTIAAPAPVLTTISPMAAVAGSSDVSLTVSGSDFFDSSTVRWNGVDLATNYVSDTQLTAILPASDLAAVQTAQVAVFTPAPGGGTSSVMAFFVTKATSEVTGQDVASGEDETASAGQATATATGDGLLVVAQYDANPGGTPSFTASGTYFDVYAAPDSGFTQISIEVCGLSPNEKLFWWDSANDKWVKASPQSYDSVTGCVTLMVDDTSSPSLSQLAGTAFATGTDTVSNTAPVANPGGPYLGAINTDISFNGSGSSDPDGDALTYTWDFGDDGTGSDVMPIHSYTAAGIYNVCLTVNDGVPGSAESCTLAVVYDPSAGFVTGGGWIDSPAGAYLPDPNLSGRATFGFVSKYKKGASVPEGNTEFQFLAGGFNFHSTAYEWLVVSKNQVTAQFKGSGTVNGTLGPNGNAYKFMLWAGDGSPDTFRIRIWWEDADAVENVVYDNGFDQALDGGSIVVHTGK